MTQNIGPLEPVNDDDILIVYGFHQARRYPEFDRDKVFTLHGVTAFARLRGRRPKRVFYTGLGQSREAIRLRRELARLEVLYGTKVLHVDELLHAAIDAEFMKDGPCFICGDKYDHYGIAHGTATGDGRTRADIHEESPSA